MLKLNNIILITLINLLTTNTQAQQRLITGNISDAATKEPLPYATISLKKQLIGTISNESGNFDFYIPSDLVNDTLTISSLGYKPVMFVLSAITQPLMVRLQSSMVDVKEIQIRPLPPTYYIKQAILSIKANYPNSPFQTEAYYREKVTENNALIDFNEAIFRTYYQNYTDTATKNQHQLLIFQQADEKKKIAFMSEQNKKKKEKQKKKDGDKEEKESISISGLGGGPETILSLDIVRDKEPFLDSTTFKYYNYSFAPSSSYQNKELMVIDFKSRRVLDHVKMEGKIYLDVESNAIVNIEYKGRFIIPVLIKPLLFLYGLDIDNPIISKKLEYQGVNNKWYPKNIQVNISADLTKKHWFKENEHSTFEAEGIFNVNKLKTEKAIAIDPSKRFDSKKPLKDQVHNDEGNTWSGINIIKK